MFRNDVLSSIAYYSNAKNVAFNCAQQYRVPLDKNSDLELRHHYSSCLGSLLSLTEYLQDPAYDYAREFKSAISSEFVFEGFPDGDQNYNYLRELRNMIVHRGYDVNSSAHINDGRPWPILPAEVGNRNEKVFYPSYQRYLPLLIIQTSDVLESIVQQHVNNYVSLLPEMTQDEVEASFKLTLFNDTLVIPSDVKAAVLDFLKANPLPEISARAGGQHVTLKD
ncbi:hypothetical protein C4K00_2936 [Pseudomonas synxantha]|uniref:hypothetical protein n=1 Tax=Pseudomonas synxantha TaxID=47883 RepID=UPI000F565EDC|nr:hypothetical protein [Pseudomonas synxantha]AZE73164.1 hypothetical protein C4K00_2936 [Pseudomonas synxantha]